MKLNRTTQINIRLTKEEKSEIENLAHKSGKKVSDFVREKALKNDDNKDKNVNNKNIQMYLQKIDEIQKENAELLRNQTEFLKLISSKDEINKNLLDMFKLEQEKSIALSQTIEQFEKRSFSQKFRDLFK